MARPALVIGIHSSNYDYLSNWRFILQTHGYRVELNPRMFLSALPANDSVRVVLILRASANDESNVLLESIMKRDSEERPKVVVVDYTGSQGELICDRWFSSSATHVQIVNAIKGAALLKRGPKVIRYSSILGSQPLAEATC